jgi:hypothetical protein
MWQKKSGNKYHAKSSIYNGYYYQSQLEAAYAAELDLRVKAKDIKSWRRQVPLKLDVNGFHICNYRMDFEITHNNGSIELVETKGFETDLWRIKWKLLEAIYSKEHPEIKLTVVKKY